MPSSNFIAKENSVLGFKASKGQAEISCQIGANIAGDFEVNLIYHLQIPRVFKNNAKSTLLVLCKWNNRVWMLAHLFTAWFTEYFKTIVEIY